MSSSGWRPFAADDTAWTTDGMRALALALSDLADDWAAPSGPIPATAAAASVAPTVSFTYENQAAGSNTVELWGDVTGPPGTTVAVYTGDTFLGTATINGTTWTLTTPALAPGNYSFRAVAKEPGGLTATFDAIPSLTIGPATGNLDLSKYTLVWQQDFTKTSAIDQSIFPIVYGNADQFSWGPGGLTLASFRNESFSNVGILQPNWQGNLSQGYGLYSITMSHPANQGRGIAVLLWPANNKWPGPEIDIVEDFDDPTSQTATASVHFKGPNGQDMANTIKMTVDLTKPNTFSLDWEDGSLSYYINGTKLFEITGTEVPKDWAHGGVNAAFGAQITDIGTSYQPGDVVSMTIENMSYSALTTSLNSPGGLIVIDPIRTHPEPNPLQVPIAVQRTQQAMAMNEPTAAIDDAGRWQALDQTSPPAIAAASPLPDWFRT